MIAQSDIDVQFISARKCIVLRGRWDDPYTNRTFKKPRLLDIDHIVPLSNAHSSGASEWNRTKKRDFANNFDNLVAVYRSANRSKGDKSPDEWKPSNADYHCEYAQRWIQVKDEWQLSVTAAEKQALAAMLGTCPASPVVVVPTPVDTPTPEQLVLIPTIKPTSVLPTQTPVKKGCDREGKYITLDKCPTLKNDDVVRVEGKVKAGYKVSDVFVKVVDSYVPIAGVPQDRSYEVKQIKLVNNLISVEQEVKDLRIGNNDDVSLIFHVKGEKDGKVYRDSFPVEVVQ